MGGGRKEPRPSKGPGGKGRCKTKRGKSETLLGSKKKPTAPKKQIEGRGDKGKKDRKPGLNSKRGVNCVLGWGEEDSRKINNHVEKN